MVQEKVGITICSEISAYPLHPVIRILISLSIFPNNWLLFRLIFWTIFEKHFPEYARTWWPDNYNHVVWNSSSLSVWYTGIGCRECTQGKEEDKCGTNQAFGTMLAEMLHSWWNFAAWLMPVTFAVGQVGQRTEEKDDEGWSSDSCGAGAAPNSNGAHVHL